LKALSAAKEHTIQERGGGRDPGVSLFCRSGYFFFCYYVALEFHQERTKVVCSNKDTRKRLAEPNLRTRISQISTGVVDQIDHKIISDFNPPFTIDRNSLQVNPYRPSISTVFSGR